MRRAPGINLALQLLFAGCRYALMGLVYSKMTIAEVGHINAILTYVTAATFITGLELHHLANRALLLKKSNTVRFGADRLLSAAVILVLLALFSTVWLPESSRIPHLPFFIFAAATVEYIGLELTRIHVAQSRFLVATVCGFLRSAAPFLAAFTQAPTLTAMLWFWIAGSLLSSVIQIAVLRRRSDIAVERRWLDRADYLSAAHFFLAGVSMALLPTIERFLVSRFYSADALGQYSLSITLVSAADLVVTGALWQPFTPAIMRGFADPTRRSRTVALIVAALILTYGSFGLAATALSGFIFELLNKHPPAIILLAAAFLVGFAKSLYSVAFYGSYALHREKNLPLLQGAMVILLTIAIVGGTAAGWSFGKAMMIAASLWILVLFAQLFRLVHLSTASPSSPSSHSNG